MARWKNTTPAPTASAKNKVELTWTVGFLTPMFGGGVFVDPDKNTRHLKKCDPITPVRASAIRGQLRFWWRAAVGSRLESCEAMRAREAWLFGGTGQRSHVEVAVVGPQPRVKAIESDKALDYGTFPLRPERGSTNKDLGKLSRLDEEFKVKITCRGLEKKDIEEIEQATETWLALGGLGGRTRRGFGALHGGRWTMEQVVTRGKGESLTGLPSLSGAHFKDRPAKSSDDAHRILLSKLKEFRQGKGVGRNPGHDPKRPGRSRWPEPDELRAMLRQAAPQHQQRLVSVGAFPRGLFGMPIIFHFKDKEDPGSPTLTPAGRDLERLASPLVLRPWKEPGKSAYRAIALVLADPSRRQLEGEVDGKKVRLHLEKNEADWAKSPLQGEPDPLIAFLNFFAE